MFPAPRERLPAVSITNSSKCFQSLDGIFYRNENPTLKLMWNLRRIQREKIISKRIDWEDLCLQLQSLPRSYGHQKLWSGRMTDTRTSGMEPRRRDRLPMHGEGFSILLPRPLTGKSILQPKMLGETRYPLHKKDQHWALISDHYTN